MSDADIQFDDIAYREPLKARRPDLDPRLACIAYRLPGHEDMPIFLERKPADAIERHALRDTSVELGGILLGKECLDETTGEPFVWITEALEAKHYENTQASFTYTHDSWGEITRERDEKYPDLDIVGWYHTHPDFGIFLSSHDLFIHHNFFDQKLQVAYVVDPVRHDRGFFHWRDGRMVQTGGFWLAAARSERLTLSRLVNDLEGIPNADGGGGVAGLSPRLEAELIAMLSRPQTVAVHAADRGQTAAVFTLLGVMLGGMAIAAALWLQALSHTAQDQVKQIESLAKAQKTTIAEVKEELAAARTSAKEAALDSLLGDLKLDPASPKIAARLSKVIAQSEQDRLAADRLLVEKEALTDRAATLSMRARGAEQDLADQRKRHDSDEKMSNEEIKGLKEKVEKLSDDAVESARLIKDNVSLSLLRRYNWTWYLAAAGWIGFVACGLGLLVVLTREPPHDPDTDRRDDEKPMHTVSLT